MLRHVGTLAFGLAVSACVVGTPLPPSRVELARGPSNEPGGGSPAACAGARTERPPRPAKNAVFIDGYCHFDGARYAFVPGRWETPLAGNGR